MGEQCLESGYTECSTSHGSHRFAIVRELWNRRRHLEMGWQYLEPDYTEQSDQHGGKLLNLTDYWLMGFLYIFYLPQNYLNEEIT
jgi:hypothetical protein